MATFGRWRTCTIRKNSKKETALLDWFEIPASQRPHVVEVIPQPDIEAVRVNMDCFLINEKQLNASGPSWPANAGEPFPHWPGKQERHEFCL